MNDRDELANVLFAIMDERIQTKEYALKVADAILAAGYRKPRTITTAAELVNLAKGTVLRDFDGDVVVADPGPEDMWFRQIDETWPLSAKVIAFPATVLYEPQP